MVVTLHRPSNVDDAERIRLLADVLSEIAIERPVVFPAHPRTKQRLEAAGLKMDRVRVLEPVGYLEMLNLIEHAFRCRHRFGRSSGGDHRAWRSVSHHPPEHGKTYHNHRRHESACPEPRRYPCRAAAAASARGEAPSRGVGWPRR